MFNSRSIEALFLAATRHVLTLVVAVIAFGAISGATGTAARADDLPFWEKADLEKAKKAKYASNSKYSKKSSAQYAAASKSHAKKKLGGYAEATEPVRHKKKGVKVAALGNSYYPDSAPKKSLSGGSVRWAASSGCLDGGLRAIIYQVASNYGPLTVNSTCRSPGHNRAVGGVPHSMHLSGNAVDFRVSGNVSAVYAYLKSNGGVGGLKHYGGGLFHIDTGARRSW